MTTEAEAKTRRPRRMAREPGTQSPVETNTTVAGKIADAEAPRAAGAAPKAPSKIGTVLALLRRTEGATLEEMMEATGWLTHTVRASLTGLKKKGHVIQRGKRGETTCYNLEGGA